jgi:hypothetical protein
MSRIQNGQMVILKNVFELQASSDTQSSNYFHSFMRQKLAG